MRIAFYALYIVIYFLPFEKWQMINFLCTVPLFALPLTLVTAVRAWYTEEANRK